MVELAEYAIEKIARTMEQVEDSEGEVYSVLERLQELHKDVCETAKPDPVLLAERLFRYEVEKGLDVFYGCLEIYEEALGPMGLRRFRELVEAAWAEIPVLNAHSYGDTFSSQRWRLSRMMESLAQSSGDIEALVSIKARDLSSAERYLGIATIYQGAGDADKALDWAERGLREFPKQPSNTLRNFLVAEYLKRGRHDEAVLLTWLQFAEQPQLEFYQKLNHVTEPLGLWPEQRLRALAELEAVIQRAMNVQNRYLPKPLKPDHSERVRIALWEGDLETAWQAIQDGNCRVELRISVADAIASTRPDDALVLYQATAAAFVEQTNNQAYDAAIRLIRKAQLIMPMESFADYVAELRVKFKSKRNFIKLLGTIKPIKP